MYITKCPGQYNKKRIRNKRYKDYHGTETKEKILLRDDRLIYVHPQRSKGTYQKIVKFH